MLGNNIGDDTLRSEGHEEQGIDKETEITTIEPPTPSPPKGMTPPSVVTTKMLVESTTDTRKQKECITNAET
jgi:hypothetical protein